MDTSVDSEQPLRHSAGGAPLFSVCRVEKTQQPHYLGIILMSLPSPGSYVADKNRLKKLGEILPGLCTTIPVRHGKAILICTRTARQRAHGLWGHSGAADDGMNSRRYAARPPVHMIRHTGETFRTKGWNVGGYAERRFNYLSNGADAGAVAELKGYFLIITPLLWPALSATWFVVDERDSQFWSAFLRGGSGWNTLYMRRDRCGCSSITVLDHSNCFKTA
ncbi:hypothetical protein LZ32DRAFT_614207 [Colletotrichum eremochloae]|nr:hypothetical protein LZ32DRAFT_614207 [Colletotrichum eremochloae]